MDLKSQIRRRASELGFELVGFAPAIQAGTWDRLREWLSHGFSGEMKYLDRRQAAYQHPSSVLPTVRSLIMLGLVHGGTDGKAVSSVTAAQKGAVPRIARYAQGSRDYHDLIREKLSALADAVHELSPGCRTRGVVDTAPLLERDFARLAGLGWFGKNTMLINKRLGSYLFLAALLTDLDLEPDQPHETAHCGTCTRCLDACPTSAFPEPYVLDATRCISYLTIELRGVSIPEPLRPEMQDWILGCDICQDVCPWNRKAPSTRIDDLCPDPQLVGRTLRDWLSLSPEEFEQVYLSTPLARPGWQGITRNACIAAANQAAVDCLPQIALLAEHPDPVVAEAARWAAERLTNRHAQPARHW